MLKLSQSLTNVRVMSLRAGGAIGIASGMIINPNNLRVEGWYVHNKFSSDNSILVRDDIRDISSQGIIVNDHDALTDPEELVRLKPVMDIGFDLMGKHVVSQSGKKYGKVSDFAVETESMYVKKIYTNQALIKNFSGGSHSIDRTQIVEITNKKIIIEDPVEKAKAVAPSPSLIN